MATANGKRVAPMETKPAKRRKGVSRWTLRRQQLDDINAWKTGLPLEGRTSAATPAAAPEMEQPSCQLDMEESPIDDTPCSLAADAAYNVFEDDDDDENETDSCEVGPSGSYFIDETLSVREQLGRWAVFFSISGTALSVLLKILVAYEVVRDLPKDSRTVLQTARSVVTKKVSGGEYFHFGISECLSRLLSRLSDCVFQGLDEVLEIVINMDGLPCFKSVSSQVWPILGALRVNGRLSTPFTIGLFYGRDKDKVVDEVLCDFVSDYNECSTTGFWCRNRQFKVQVYAVVCDAPARSFVKNVQGHSAKAGCERCMQVGKKKKYTGVYYAKDKGTSRTDDLVAAAAYKRHSKGRSPLSYTNIKLVSQVVLDYMHLVLLGVMRRLLNLWLESTKEREGSTRYRVSGATADAISSVLLSLIESCPKEFARKPRSLSHFKMFKATELRTILLYTGLVAFKGKVAANVYSNFLLLSCAMRINLSRTYCSNTDYRRCAKKLVKSFVKQFRELYTKRDVVYNVHNMLHIYKDVKKYGCLDNVSAFPFENHLHSFKRMVRSGSRTLQQIVRRLDESHRHSFTSKDVFDSCDRVRYLHLHDFDLPAVLQPYRHKITAQYKAVVHNNTRYSVFRSDFCIRLSDSSVGTIMNIVMLNDKSCLLVYKAFKSRKAHFTYPLDSQTVGISRVSNLDTTLRLVDLSTCRKAWLMPVHDKNYSVAVDLLNCKSVAFIFFCVFIVKCLSSYNCITCSCCEHISLPQL